MTTTAQNPNAIAFSDWDIGGKPHYRQVQIANALIHWMTEKGIEHSPVHYDHLEGA